MWRWQSGIRKRFGEKGTADGLGKVFKRETIPRGVKYIMYLHTRGVRCVKIKSYRVHGSIIHDVDVKNKRNRRVYFTQYTFFEHARFNENPITSEKNIFYARFEALIKLRFRNFLYARFLQVS